MAQSDFLMRKMDSRGNEKTKETGIWKRLDGRGEKGEAAKPEMRTFVTDSVVL